MSDTDLSYEAPISAVLEETGTATEDELLGDFSDNSTPAEEDTE